MSTKKNIQISLMDKTEWCFSLNVTDLGDVLNFEIFKDNEDRLGEVGLDIRECEELKEAIELFIKIQKRKKPKSKAGRKKIYEGDTETLSIHVPSDKKEYIRSVVDALLEPMKIKN
jgi:hypothetical protein